MKTIKYVPELCKTEGSGWTGHVVLALPSFDQKCDYVDQVQQLIEDNASMPEAKRNMRVARKLVSLSQPHYVSCELTSTKGDEAKSFDDMQYIEELHAVLIEVSGLLAQGFRVGNA
jgi:hypothetical protein